LKLKPPASLRKHKLRGLIAVGVMTASISGVVVAQSAPAYADPTQTLVAVGSDTIQDVYNQFSTDLGGNALGSYNATNPVTGTANEIITPVDGSGGVNCSFARPNGSGPGQGALEQALGQPETGGTAPLPQTGCVDIARSSAGPNASGIGSGNFTGANAIQFVPFALDAVTGAIGPATGGVSFNAPTGTGTTVPATTVATQLPAAVGSFTQADLTTLYKSCGTVTEGGVTFWPFQPAPAVQPAGTTRIDLYIPQLGSGTEKFWATETGNWTPTTPAACVNDTIINGALSTDNVSIEEHDGTDVATDPFGYTPFSIAQWIAQNNGHNDRRHGAALQAINGVAPLSGTRLNTSFPFTRDVYSVVSLARLQNTSDPIHSLLDGINSFVCKDGAQIASYGFAQLGAACGEIIPSLTAQP
jgi:ABC-type phosphate transport system substrate-binding protein